MPVDAANAQLAGKNEELAEANAALAKANTELEEQKSQLAETNKKLQAATQRATQAEQEVRREADIATAISTKATRKLWMRSHNNCCCALETNGTPPLNCAEMSVVLA